MNAAPLLLFVQGDDGVGDLLQDRAGVAIVRHLAARQTNLSTLSVVRNKSPTSVEVGIDSERPAQARLREVAWIEKISRAITDRNGRR